MPHKLNITVDIIIAAREPSNNVQL